MARHRIGQRAVLIWPIDIEFVEQHVKGDGARRLRGNPVDQFTMDRARPGPATGQIIHLFERTLVDIDNHHAIGFRSALRIDPQHHIPGALVNHPGEPDPSVIDHGQQRKQRGNGKPVAHQQMASAFNQFDPAI